MRIAERKTLCCRARFAWAGSHEIRKFLCELSTSKSTAQARAKCVGDLPLLQRGALAQAQLILYVTGAREREPKCLQGPYRKVL